MLYTQDVVEQMVREGTVLDSGDVLYLEPTWINELLRAILNHQLAEEGKERFWEEELKAFSNGNNEVYRYLKEVHDNFPSTGILNVRYLRFLWRMVKETGDKAFFKSLLRTMSLHGIIFLGNPSHFDSENDWNPGDDNAKLFVPLHLPSTILDNDLEEFAMLFKHQFRKEFVYEIDQSYMPPGILGLLMGRFLLCNGVRFRKCWSRGALFTLKEVLVLLHLDHPSHVEDKARITVNLFGERFVSELDTTMDAVKNGIDSMFIERFRGLFFSLKQGYPRDVDGFNAADLDTLIARIDGLESHLDRELSRVVQGLQKLEENLQDVSKSCNAILARLSKFQSREVPCPSLVIVRPAAAMVPQGQKRSLWAIVEGLGRRSKHLVHKDMRLCFLCPYDFSEVTCGLDGNGYPFTVTREWVRKIRPVLKVRQ